MESHNACKYDNNKLDTVQRHVSNTNENSDISPNLNVLSAFSRPKGMQKLKLCSNRILHFLAGVVG